MATALELGSDRRACRGYIRVHSKSFYLSSLLLPARVRHAAWALYAFCRRADDAVDEPGQGAALSRVAELRRRLERVYHGTPVDDPIDRAFFAVVSRHGLPRALPEALFDGMEMDARPTRYRDDGELLVYCFRVAATVGLMMTRVMGVEDEIAYLRAADLGVAMQLTNIARDVGEDARRGRVYLPEALLASVGLDRGRLLAMSEATPASATAVRLLLGRADAHYRAADRGIPLLPRDCRFAIAASRHIYSGIGGAILANRGDSISRRAYLGPGAKLLHLVRALPAPFASGGDAHRPGPADEPLRSLLRGVGLPA